MSREMIDRIKKDHLRSIESTLKSTYLAHKYDEINSKTRTEVKKREEELFNQNRHLVVDKNKPPYTPYNGTGHYYYQIPTTEIRPGVFIESRHEDRFRVPDYPIRQRYTTEYEERFTKTIWEGHGGLEALISAEIEALKPEAVLNQLLQRHPWLKNLSTALTIYSTSIIYKFMEDFIQEQLLTLLKSKISSWNDLSLSAMESKKLEWKPVDEDRLEKHIEGYPLSAVESFYIKSVREEYPSQYREHASYNYSGNAGPEIQKFNAPLTRIDVLRLLHNNDSSAMKASIVNGIACTTHAPFHYEELKLLSPTEWDFFETLVINMGTEKSPCWIALNKEQTGGWTAYIPDSGDVAIGDLEKRLSAVPGKIKTQLVNYDSNRALNNIDKLNNVTEWHAVLFGRVIPWCTHQQATPLAAYRNNVPLSLLHQQTIEQCLSNVGAYSYYYSSSELKAVTQAFRYRQPFTKKSMYELKANFPTIDRECLLESFSALGNVNASDILTAFDKRQIQISADLKDLSVHEDYDQYLFNALTVSYHNPSISRISFRAYSNPQIDKLFEYDVNLKTAKPSSHHFEKRVFANPMQCVARNRFLEAAKPDVLNNAKNGIRERRILWDSTGPEIVEFFKLHGKSFDLDFANSVNKFNTEWRKTFCDHEKRGSTTETEWAFAQIAQMGPKGLDEMFKVLEGYTLRDMDSKEPAPNLDCTFDLHGGLTDEPHDYIKHLTTKINNFDFRKKGCVPLFKSLSLIVPEPLTVESKKALLNLIRAVDARRKAFPKDIGEVVLHNIKNSADNADFIKELHKMATAENLQVVVNIPEWNRTAYKDRPNQELKSLYRMVQNKVLDNQRKVNHAKLPDNTKSIYDCAEGTLDPEVFIDEKLEQLAQPWEGPDEIYPLSSQAPGIQQQLQQALAQEFQAEQEEEQQQEQEQEQEQEINQYREDEKDLITRGNIDEKCRANWESLQTEVKELSGWTKSDLSQLFSLWVGSEKDAPQVIEKIQPAAIQKLMEKASQFRMAIAKDNMPPGFYLAYSRNNKGLILCYDEAREKKALRERNLLPASKRNPFTVELHQPREAKEFHGDYRQFAAISSQTGEQQTLWQYLSIEDKDKQRRVNAKAFLDQKSHDSTEETASVIMQRWDVDNTLNSPDDFDACMHYVKKWAIAQKASPELAHALFEDSATKLTPSNLKAFGQLFNHYDIQTKHGNGSNHWLFIADQVLTNFGPEHFAIWKKRFLDASQNWSEYLEKEDVDALSLSIVTLKDKPDYQAIWWKLVDKHGEATGHMRYKDVWYAYQQIIRFVEDKNLNLNKDALFRYLDKTNDFNAKVFFDRLNRVLKNASNQLNAEIVQQRILDHIDKIDWRHNGFYYASRYEGYPYWDEALEQTRFTTTTKYGSTGYRVNWDDPTQDIISPALHALRFASKRIKLSVLQFDEFQSIIKSCNPQKKDAPHLRILVACLGIGVDKLDKSNSEEIVHHFKTLQSLDPDFIEWFNEQLILDEDELLAGTLKMRVADIVPFARLIEQQGMTRMFESLKVPNGLEAINAFGRALQCYQSLEGKGSNSEEQFVRLLKFSKHKGSLSLRSLITDYPWLIDDCKDFDTWISPAQKALSAHKVHYWSEQYHQYEIFRKQLQSIDFSKSTNLPKESELESAFAAILSDSVDPAKTRRDIISKWCLDGCDINYQDAEFRKLEQQESVEAGKYMQSQLKPRFKEQNLALCERFIRDYVAVKASLDQSQQITQLLNQLARLDNKAHYDELGKVLGLLISKAAKKDGSRYSAPQLAKWLEYFLDEDNYSNQHYPVNLLNELLDNALETNSSLLNRDLNSLKERSAFPVQELTIKKVAQSRLPNQYKPILVKLALKDASKLHFVLDAQQKLLAMHDAKVNVSWMNAATNLIGSVADLPSFTRLSTLEELTKPAEIVFGASVDETQKELWQETQIKLIDLFSEGAISNSELETYLNSNSTKSAHIKMILSQAVNWKNEEEKNKLPKLWSQLQALDETQLKELASYYGAEPIPSATLLSKLLEKDEFKVASALIHHFETVEQGLNADKSQKRHYSINPSDKASLMRVLSGFKRKGAGLLSDNEQKELINLLYYTNNYHQVAQLHTLPAGALQGRLYQALDEIKTATEPHERHLASARLLACMREVLLRKSGKWANHTQMLDLLYAALYNDESLIHQVRTGQGKSIITVMRSAYLALNGYVVDVFSAKDSLSKRDHEEFAPVLDGMGIGHAYITENAPADRYQTASARPGIGAVNYATIGNFSLFQSTHIWKGETAIPLDPANRVAWLDECDHILKDEQTQFNYSDSADSDPVYNLDEWVYRATYDFYLQQRNEGQLFVDKETGIVSVGRNKHLKPLCEYLQEKAAFAPKDSTFFQKYMIPALEGGEEAIKKRDQQLKQLLTAAHIAHGLREGEAFCIRPDMKTVSGGAAINTRFAKVVISNQIRHGSTYSDLVQQFLHVRLNKEAANGGKTPDFFVDPYTQIALSQNASYLLKKYYSKLEGCTGTAGNEEDLKLYKDVYGIEHVVKLPTHEEIGTKFLPSTFSKNQQDQVDVIVEQILQHADRPILVTCKDDIAVKELAAKIQAKLKEKSYDFSKFIVDTNDSGKAEAEIVPLAGRNGAVTISSRMGRGTDIKPESKEGLTVLRTYPAAPNVAKQERGRQGRNGALGTVRDIINFKEMQKQAESFSKSERYKERFVRIQQEQRKHLEDKLQKHKERGSTKWDDLDLSVDGEKKEAYLLTRSVMQMQHEIKLEHDKFLRRKEYLIATLSGNVMDVLHQAIEDGNQTIPAVLRTGWLDCRKHIEAAWNARLSGDTRTDTEEVYQNFFKKADQAWQTLCGLSPRLDRLCLLDLAESLTALSNGEESLEKVLDKEMAYWKPRLDEGKLVKADLSRLEALKKQVKSYFIKYHPDKVSGKEKAEQEKAELISKKLSTLKDLIEACTQKLSGKTDFAEDHLEGVSLFSEAPHKGAVIPFSGKKLDSSTQKRDMKQVVEFYQQWLAGADEYYFSKDLGKNPQLITAIYGRGYSFMDEFYNQLRESSSQSDVSTLSPENQVERRELVFGTLTDVMKHSSGYCVSCKAVADVVKLLMGQGKPTESNPEQDRNYCKALAQFFDQNWLKKKEPHTLSSAEIEQNGALLSLVMKIVTTHYSAEKDATLAFVKRFSESVNEHFRESFMDSEDLAKVFASNPKITELLTLHTNKADIGYFIDLIIKNETATFGEERLTKLLDYLAKNADKLKAKPSLIRPLFTLTLLDSSQNPANNYLPEVDVLDELPRKTESSVWYFLSQRMPLKGEHCDTFFKMLLDNKEHEDLEKKVIKPLLKLPPYIPLSYITEQLKFNPGRYQLEECHSRLEEVGAAAKVLNDFMQNRGIVKSETTYGTPEKPRDYKQLVEQFTEMSPARNKEFFKTAAKYGNVPLDTVQSLARTYAEDASVLKSQTDLKKTFDLADKISRLSKDKKEFAEEKFDEALSKITLVSVEQMTDFVDLIAATGELDSQTMEQLYSEWDNKELTQQRLAVIEQIRRFEIVYTEAHLLTRYLSSNMDATVNEKYKAFLDLANNKAKYAGLGNAMYPISNAYFAGTIKTDKVKEAFDLVNEATELQKSQKYSSYFSSFARNQEKRQRLMQYLHHDLLDLDKDPKFKELCFSKYEQLAKKLSDLPVPKKLADDKKARVDLRHHFQQLIGFARELVAVAKHPFGAPNAKANLDQSAVDIVQKHNTYFAEQQKRYASFWWVNKDRRGQANTLFNNLARVQLHSADAKETYYHEALKAIWNSQKQLLASDVDTTRNSKGYSRLYDITVQMFITVANDWLTDNEASLESKVAVNGLLQEQLSFHIDLLADRLPDGKLKDMMYQLIGQDVKDSPDNRWAPGSTTLKDLSDVLKKHQNSIPKPLKYLANNLDCLISLSDTVSEEQKIAAEEELYSQHRHN
ncbi:hypothetical protein [Legionella cardiaca]|uniref:SecA family profile domain-containing protein n=1 Tax=Legionella cardiaca TaxID=1071983 RepID=A0ABY8AXA7_9GAMM|nr:hypothetical protein [Legionella cardiaca]WED44125.1 hypothetical protein PXX05_04885 [Legionella cardiaca]